MSHNRFLSLGLIIAASKTSDGYNGFETFMTKVCDYTFADDEALVIHELFIKYPETRKNLWVILGTQDFSNKKVSLGIKGLSKAWLILSNPKNEEKHEKTIKNYLELVKKCDPKYQIILTEIINVLKK